MPGKKMDPRDVVKAGYDAIASEYLASRNADSPDVRLLQELVQRLPKGARVLDAGCGAGVPVAQILSQHFDVIGVDFSEAQIALARRLVPQAQFVCQDITALQFPDRSFDAICSYYAIIHIPRQEHRRLLHNLRRMLKPAGLALLCMGAGDAPGDYEDSFQGTRMYWSHYDVDTNLQMLQECGLQIIWSRFIEDPDGSGGAHLFVLAEKAEQPKGAG
jgi:SAM-dependent methyltransferase